VRVGHCERRLIECRRHGLRLHHIGGLHASGRPPAGASRGRARGVPTPWRARGRGWPTGWRGDLAAGRVAADRRQLVRHRTGADVAPIAHGDRASRRPLRRPSAAPLWHRRSHHEADRPDASDDPEQQRLERDHCLYLLTTVARIWPVQRRAEQAERISDRPPFPFAPERTSESRLRADIMRTCSVSLHGHRVSKCGHVCLDTLTPSVHR